MTVLDMLEKGSQKAERERERKKDFCAGWGANAALGKWGTHVCTVAL